MKHFNSLDPLEFGVVAYTRKRECLDTKERTSVRHAWPGCGGEHRQRRDCVTDYQSRLPRLWRGRLPGKHSPDEGHHNLQ